MINTILRTHVIMQQCRCKNKLDFVFYNQRDMYNSNMSRMLCKNECILVAQEKNRP